MNFGDLKTMARTYVLEAKTGTIGDTEIELILNNGARDVASKAQCLPTSVKFDTKADQAVYELSSVAERFMAIDKPGLWYRESTTSDYVELLPTTTKALEEEMPVWRGLGSGDPRWYYQEGNNLGLVEAPDTDITDGLWLYFLQAPARMTAEEHYPFGLTTEITHLIPLQDAILAYWEWKAVKAINKGIDSYKALEGAYQRILGEKIYEVKRNLGIKHNRYARFQGRAFRNDTF